MNTILITTKKIHIFLMFLGMFFPLAIHAQYASEELDGNNIRTRYYADGTLFWDGNNAWFEAPKNSNQKSISAAALWIGGFDSKGILHTSAQTYRESGGDFWPGPLDSNANIDANTSSNYNKVWKITRLQVDSFLLGLSVPQVILDWPGNGDVAKGQLRNLAPYIDVDKNGIYEPMKGDYPDVKGDEMLWWVFNDNLAKHTETFGPALGIEIHASAWTYNCNTDVALKNAVFVNFEVFNRSALDYDSVYLGLWTDFDIGNYTNDFIGSNPDLKTIFAYNGTNEDPDTTVIAKSTTFHYKGYQNKLPVQALTFLKGIEDNQGKELNLSKFIYYNNSVSIAGNPKAANQFYYYLSGSWLDGKPLSTGGNGYNGNTATNLAFTGDLEDQNAWSEISANNTPGDRRGVASMGPFTFHKGESKSFTAAYSFHQANNGKTIESYRQMLQNVSNISRLYHQQALKPCTGISLCTSGDTCIWPGDANNDGVTTMSDIFNIGYGFGKSGNSRPFASNKWSGQPAQKWSLNFPDGTNFNHADANGDGIIDSADVLPLVLNIGMQHGKKSESSESLASDILLGVKIDTDSIFSGNVLTGTIQLGTEEHPAEDVFGAAFRLIYDTSILVPGTFKFELMDGMGSNSEVVIATADRKGTTEIGIVRVDGKGVTIKGPIIKWKYVVEGNVGGVRDTKISIDNAKIVNPKLQNIEVYTEDASVVVKQSTSISNPKVLNALINVYPNPFSDILNITAHNLKITQVKVINLQGQIIIEKEIKANELQLDASTLRSGIYFIEITTNEGRIVKKIIRSR